MVMAMVLVGGCATTPSPAEQRALSIDAHCDRLLLSGDGSPEERAGCMRWVTDRRKAAGEEKGAGVVALEIIGGMAPTEEQERQAADRQQTETLRQISVEQRRLADEQRRMAREAEAQRNREIYRRGR